MHGHAAQHYMTWPIDENFTHHVAASTVVRLLHGVLLLNVRTAARWQLCLVAQRLGQPQALAYGQGAC